jgi:hypothetical protein
VVGIVLSRARPVVGHFVCHRRGGHLVGVNIEHQLQAAVCAAVNDAQARRVIARRQVLRKLLNQTRVTMRSPDVRVVRSRRFTANFSAELLQQRWRPRRGGSASAAGSGFTDSSIGAT